MLLKTHLAINFFFALFFSSYVQYRAVFIALVLLATSLPDIDSLNSYISRRARPLSIVINFFSRHRGFFHSFTFAALLGFFMLAISSKIAFPIFLGYSLHLLADSFTIEGIMIFFPFKARAKGRVRTNGLTEKIIFAVFFVIDVIYLAYVF